ncbi:MAG: hypothetical protein ACJ8DX_15005 [Xanthobacteraceae bacterium]
MNGWKSIASAPRDQDVQLWVEDRFGARALPYACRLTVEGWVNSELKVRLANTIKPAYWREWSSAADSTSPSVPKDPIAE